MQFVLGAGVLRRDPVHPSPGLICSIAHDRSSQAAIGGEYRDTLDLRGIAARRRCTHRRAARQRSARGLASGRAQCRCATWLSAGFPALLRPGELPGTLCACARALATRAPIVVGDVMSDAAFAPYRDIADRAGFRAVQSTPLISSSSALVGMVSTHFPATHAPTDQELASLQEAGRRAADKIIAQRARRRMSGSSLATQREMEKAEEYLQCSAECRERALHSQDTAVRQQFLDLAGQWQELAAQIE